MSNRHTARRRWEMVAGGLLALVLGFGFAGDALADNVVRTRVNGGTLTASADNLNLGAVNYSHADQPKSGTLAVTADDSTGANLGWNVSVIASDFIYDDTHPGGLDIPAENFSLITINEPGDAIAGQAVHEKGGPLAVTTSIGGLDQSRKILLANPGYGKGTYGQDLDVELVVPGDSLAGAYVSTLTFTIVAGPGA